MEYNIIINVLVTTLTDLHYQLRYTERINADTYMFRCFFQYAGKGNTSFTAFIKLDKDTPRLKLDTVRNAYVPYNESLIKFGRLEKAFLANLNESTHSLT